MEVPYSNTIRKVASSSSEASDNLMEAMIKAQKENEEYVVSKVTDNKTLILKRINVPRFRQKVKSKRRKKLSSNLKGIQSLILSFFG